MVRLVRMVRMVSGIAGTVCVLLVALAGPAFAGDSPGGFYYGADGSGPTAVGSFPYQEPTTGGTFGGYVGEVYTWSDYLGCTSGREVNQVDVADANYNAANYHVPVPPYGTMLYWFMGGAGVDPGYNGTGTEAYHGGQVQAQAAMEVYNGAGPAVYSHLVWMDIEAGPSYRVNGWNHVASSCGTNVTSNYVAPNLDRDTFNGFWNYIHNSTAFAPGAYSAPDFWSCTFGTSYGSIPHTYEWTYEYSSISVNPGPSSWCQTGYGCAEFFGGQDAASSYALAWQWSLAGGDYDQFDANRF